MSTNVKAEMEQLIEAYSEIEGASVKRPLTGEVKRFVSYILASNGKISDGEAEFLGRLLGREFTSEELANYITAENVFSKAFSETIPNVFKRNIHNTPASFCYVNALSNIGREAVVSDKKADREEVEAFLAYVNMLCDYYNEQNAENPIRFEQIAGEAFHVDGQGATAAEDDETLEELLAELDGLIGLESVKRNVHSLLHLQSIQLEREKRGLPKIPMTNHLVFTGNPGTGKTTVARLIARIYKKIGLLSTGNFVEVDRSGMVAGYVGQTAIEVKNVMDSAKGGVLFIDEAYALANGLQGDYGMEAIETLLKRMEDDREDMVVIAAGYPKLMERFISSNPGLRSRFSKKIHFPDYTPEELLEILQYMVKKQSFTISEAALDLAYEVLEKKYDTRTEDFANAREVRNFFESAVVSQADRLYGKENLSDEELCRLEVEDFKYNELMIE